MVPSLPWASLWCLNLCIICRLAFYPCGSERPAASSVLGAPQCLQYNKPGKLTGSHNTAWQLQARLPVPALYTLIFSELISIVNSPCLFPSLIQFKTFYLCPSILVVHSLYFRHIYLFIYAFIYFCDVTKWTNYQILYKYPDFIKIKYSQWYASNSVYFKHIVTVPQYP